MKVFVTGASGFVGMEIVRQLVQSGHSAKLLLRSIRPQQWISFAKKPVEYSTGSVLLPAHLASAMQGCDAVIHLVGIISEMGESTFENVHVNGTRNAIEAAKAAGIRRFIHMSAMGAREHSPSRYHQTKWRAEELVCNSGLDYTIFRPSIIYGRQDHFVNLFARMSRYSPFLPVMGSGKSLMQPISVKEVAACFAGALGEPGSIGQTYELGGAERLSFNQILDDMLRVMRRRRLKIHVPMALARLQASLMEYVFPKILRKPSPLTRDQLLMLQENNVGNSRAALDLFKIQPEPFDQGIAHYLLDRTRG